MDLRVNKTGEIIAKADYELSRVIENIFFIKSFEQK